MKKLTIISAILIMLVSCGKKSDNGMENFTKIDSKDIEGNFIEKMADDWALITAGTAEKFNTMTASWGLIGHLWNKPVAVCFVRPQRYTFEFMEAADTFTLSFFDENYRDALNICGTLSGRDVNKVEKAGLTPLVFDTNSISFGEARMIIECRKIYADFFNPEKFINAKIPADIYPTNDFHKAYVGEIINVWVKK